MKTRLLLLIFLAFFISACGARISLEGESVVVDITPPSGEQADVPVVIQDEESPAGNEDASVLSNPFVIGLLVLLGVIIIVLLVRATDRRPRSEADTNPPSASDPRHR